MSLNAQQDFMRHSIIPTVQYEPGGGGFGGFVAGVDFDNDGAPEIYAINTNFIDRAGELIPRIYKFEWNEATASWDSVWGATPGIPLQNTWPALTWGDLDDDGKPEIIWSPTNYFDATNTNPWRFIVYEVVGDGSDNLGVDDGFGSFIPNATTTLTSDDNFDLRPVKSLVMDIDNDGTEEIIFADRSSNAAGYSYGVLSVDNIPDLGGGGETWTVEASGLGDPILTGTGPKWDVAVVGSVIYLFAQSGLVYPIKYDAGTYTALDPQSGIANLWRFYLRRICQCSSGAAGKTGADCHRRRIPAAPPRHLGLSPAKCLFSALVELSPSLERRNSRHEAHDAEQYAALAGLAAAAQHHHPHPGYHRRA
jgi:hypothetical protein